MLTHNEIVKLWHDAMKASIPEDDWEVEVFARAVEKRVAMGCIKIADTIGMQVGVLGRQAAHAIRDRIREEIIERKTE